jgi:hypothetical protein
MIKNFTITEKDISYLQGLIEDSIRLLIPGKCHRDEILQNLEDVLQRLDSVMETAKKQEEALAEIEEIFKDIKLNL